MRLETKKNLKRYLCRNQQWIHNRFLTIIGTAVFILCLVLTALLIARDFYNRRMLNARARIQITLVRTGVRRGVFTEAEMREISDNWTNAEYNYVETNEFPANEK